MTDVSERRGVSRGVLPDGVEVRPLDLHPDDRGRLFEMHRECWWIGAPLVQWNCVISAAGALRGVHAHVDHEDYLVVAQGRMVLGLHDLRPYSPTDGRGFTLLLSGDRPCGVRVPIGVAHGFYFPVASTLLYGLSGYWSMDDELGCHWADPGLEIDWPECDPVLSRRDREAGSLETLREQFLAAWAKA